MIRELEIRTSRDQPIVVTIAAVRYGRGDDRHLLVPFLHCLSHSLPIFLVFPSSNSDSEILRKTNTHAKLNLYYWLENLGDLSL